jgi:hypothetical protein
MNGRLPIILLACLVFTLQAFAQNPVWSTDIAPVLFNKCASCHRPNGIGPFSLLTYNDASSRAGSIANSVQNKHMPPWPPDPSFSRLAHERLLSQQEITKISQWLQAGVPQGDPNLAPPQPIFNTNGDLPGTPDLAIKIPTYTSTALSGDVYQCFVIPSGLATDKFITAFEAVPGNRPIVHHVLVYADTTGNCAQLDAATTEPGYTSFGGVGEGSAKLLGGWVPGTAPLTFPQGFGVRLPKNADIVIQVHYPHGSNGQKDSTNVNFFFSTAGNMRNVSIDPVLNHATNITPALVIPANQTKSFTEQFQVPNFFNVSVLGIAPHMHLIGRKIDCFGVTPQGDSIKFVKINNWDFHWQGFYMLRQIKKVPGGTMLYSNAFYDNTSNNPFNPSNPPKNVIAGESTTDEMMLTYLIWTTYKTGDENIVMDTSKLAEVSIKTNYYTGQQLLMPYPNPADKELVVKYHFDNNDEASVELVDMQGKVVKELMKNEIIKAGYTASPYDISNIPSGIYLLQLRTRERTQTEKVVITH